MPKRKKPVYKTGKRNPNAYVDVRVKKRILILTLLIIAAIISGIVTVLDKTGVISWGELLHDFQAIDTVGKTDSDFSVYYLNAGQSDCSIIVCDDKVMMVDAGSNKQTKNIAMALKSLDIQNIDYLFITHQHDDHIGCAAWVVEEYNVKNVVMPRLSKENIPTTVEYEELLQTIDKNDVKVFEAKPGFNFTLGSASINVFAPSKQDKNLNNMSAVFKVTYGETSFLFQGDAEKRVENELIGQNLDLSADVIKLGHHGSKTSSTEKYLEAVSPKVAVISCGLRNDYGHPSLETIETLEANKIDYFITAEVGGITAVSDGKTVKLTTSDSKEEKIYD